MGNSESAKFFARIKSFSDIFLLILRQQKEKIWGFFKHDVFSNQYRACWRRQRQGAYAHRAVPNMTSRIVHTPIRWQRELIMFVVSISSNCFAFKYVYGIEMCWKKFTSAHMHLHVLPIQLSNYVPLPSPFLSSFFLEIRLMFCPHSWHFILLQHL